MGRCHRAAWSWALAAVASVATLTHASPQPGTGTIRGHIRLVAEAPPNPPVRMGADPACSQLWKETRPTQEFVVRDADGDLANAFVHLKGHFPETPVPSTPVVLDQQGCLYRPHVIGIRAGQRLEIRNGDPTTHNVHSLSAAGNDFNMSRQAGGEPIAIELAHPELMMRLTCDIHSWMNIYVGVMGHPYFAVSGRDGRFTIPDVPAGHYELEVWHERYGPKTVGVHVEAAADASVDFVYEGTEKAAPASLVSSVPLPPATASLMFVAAN